MKFVIIFLLSLLSFSAKSQKLDHIYRTDTSYLLDGKTHALKAKKAQRSTFIFKIDNHKSSTIHITSSGSSKSMKVVDTYNIMEPQDDGGYVSIYMIEDVENLQTYLLVLLFEANKKLVAIALGDGPDIIAFEVKE